MQDHRSSLDLFIHQQITNPLKTRCQTALSNMTNYQSSLDSPKRSHNYLPLQQQTSAMNKSPQIAAKNETQSYLSSSNKSETVRSPVFKQSRKSVVLEQENQALKNQVELLQNALLQLCKDQSLQGALLPILETVSQQTNIADQLKIIQKIQNCSDSKKQSEKITHQKKPSGTNINRKPLIQHSQKISFSGNSPSQRAMFETNKVNDSNHLQHNQSSLNYSSSPVIIGSTTRSAQRRKRSDRQQEIHKCPSRNFLHIVDKENSPAGSVIQDYLEANTKSSPSFREDMPLQINCRRPMATDDTLVFDKSNDICVFNNGTDRQINMLTDKTIERIDNLNQDSMAMCSNIEAIMSKEDDEPRVNDGSQIQIKYAKMLEELENEDYESPENNNRMLKIQEQEFSQRLQNEDHQQSPTNSNSLHSMSRSQEVKMTQYKTNPKDVCARESRQTALQQTYHSIHSIDDMMGEKQQRYYDSLSKQDLEKTTKMSCNVEQKHYYENQLSCLKSELNLFTKEEEKLLQMMEPQGVKVTFEIETPQMRGRLNQQKTSDQQTIREIDQDSPMGVEEGLGNRQAYLISFQPRIFTTHDRERESIQATPIQMNLHNLKEFDEMYNNNQRDTINQLQNAHQQYLTQANLADDSGEHRHQSSQQTQNQMLFNLREAFLELQEVLQYQEEEELLKPIKITSPNTQDQQLMYIPLERMQNTERAKQIPDQLSQKSTERYFEQVGIKEQYQPDNYLASQTSPLKYPIFNSVFSGELREPPSFTLQLHKIKDSQPQRESILSSHREEIYQSSQNRLSNVDSHRKSTARGTVKGKEQIGAYELDHKVLSPKKKSSKIHSPIDPCHQAQLILSSQKEKTIQRDLSRQQLFKCPSQVLVSQQRSFSNTASKSLAQRSGRKHSTKKKPQKIIQRRDSTKIYEDEEEAPRYQLNKQIEAIDQLVQNTSKIMASDCLKQQIEPEDDDEDCYHLNLTQNMVSNHNPFKDNSTSFLQSCHEALTCQQLQTLSHQISISPQHVSYYNSNEGDERQTLQNHLSQRIEKLNQPDHYFGNYSLEKSELLKQQRNISIKRAEDLLEQFLKENSQRPEFVSDAVRREMAKIGKDHSYQIQKSPKFQNNSRVEEEELASPQLAPEMSFQKLIDQHKINNRQPSDVSCQLELVNLEIGGEKFNYLSNSDQNHQTLLSLQFEVFQKQLQERDLQEPQIISPQQTEYTDELRVDSNQHPVMEVKVYELEQQNQTQRRLGNKHNFTNVEQTQTRRKSMGEQALNNALSNTQVSTHQWQSNQQTNPPKKRLMQIKKCLGNQLVKSDSQTSSNFQSFQVNSMSCERNIAKRLNSSNQRSNILSQTHDNTNNVSTNSHIYTQAMIATKNPPQTQNTQNTFIDEPSIIYGHNQVSQKMLMVDPEVLYQQRSKSVIKKREEIIRKKMNETQSKLAAKNLKYEQFKQSKQSTQQQSNQNLNQRPLSNKRGTLSKTVNTQSRHALQEVGRNQRQQVSSQYHSKQMSVLPAISSNHTPVRGGRKEEISKPRSHLPPSAFYQSNELSDGQACLQTSQSKIIFEKRTPQRCENQPTMQHVHRSTVDLNTTDSQHSSSNQIPTTSQGRITKVPTECNSYRKRQSEAQEQPQLLHRSNQLSCSTSNFNKTNYHLNEKLDKLSCKPSDVTISMASTPMCDNKSNISQVFSNAPTSQLAPKKKEIKQQLKNSIVSRTVRMAKPKEYVQLKHEQKKLKNIISKPIGVDQNQSTQQLTTIATTHSFVSNSKTETNTLHYQRQQQSSLISQVKEELKSQRSKARETNLRQSCNRNQQQRMSSINNPQSHQRTMIPAQYTQFGEPIEEYDSENREFSSYLVDEKTPVEVYCSKTEEDYKDSQCENCLRLISKGLSTEFCLEHFGTPRCIDD